MRRQTQSGVVVVIGIIAVTAAINGLFLNFVKPSLQIPLVIAGGLLVAMGLYGVFRADDAEGHDAEGHDAEGHSDGGHGHDHGRGPRIGWLLVVPFLLLGLVVPPPLGAYSAQQDSGLPRNPIRSSEGLPPLPAGSGPVSLSLSEYSARALYDPGKTLQGRQVKLVGFISSTKTGQGWALTRMALSCCAADGYAVKVDPRGGERLPDNTWVEVTGTWEPTADAAQAAEGTAAAELLPIMRIESQREVPRPANPYE